MLSDFHNLITIEANLRQLFRKKSKKSQNQTRFHRWFEVNKLGCMLSPEGAPKTTASGCNSVEEAVVLTGNKPGGGKNNNWWTSTRGK